MSVTQRIIYIPGLGDRTIRNLGQVYIVRLWRRKFHVEANYHVVGWTDKQGEFDKKLHTLLDQIDHWAQKGQLISIVASSAGSSMALHAFARRRRQIQALVLIAPALGTINSIDPHILAINPSFKKSMEQLPVTISTLTEYEKDRILIVKPHEDKVVALEDMNIPGVHYLHLPTKGHLWTIVAALTIHNQKLMRFIQTKYSDIV